MLTVGLIGLALCFGQHHRQSSTPFKPNFTPAHASHRSQLSNPTSSRPLATSETWLGSVSVLFLARLSSYLCTYWPTLPRYQIGDLLMCHVAARPMAFSV